MTAREELERLRAIVAHHEIELRSLRALAQQASKPRLDEHATMLLLVLSECYRDDEFTTCEVFLRATTDGALLGALQAAGKRTPRSLGKWLAKHQGVPLGGLEIVNIGECREGLLWRVWRL